MLHTGASQLASGIQQLRNGDVELASGISQLAGGGGSLNSGLSQLTAGAGELQTGLGQLTNGTVRELGIGVAAAILLEIVLVRPVLLPAAEAVLGRAGWWPMSSPRPTGSGNPRRVPVPHRRPRPAAQQAHANPLNH